MVEKDLHFKARSIDRWALRNQRALDFLRKKGIQGLLEKARDVGWRGTLSFVKRQARYNLCAVLGAQWDKKYGVDTSGQIDLQHLEVVGGNKDSGHAVVSTSPRMYRFLSQFFPVNFPDYMFIDVGCGKGRVLLLALLQGFRNIIGIEFASLVCEIAQKNILYYSKNNPVRAKCSVINADATEHDFPIDVPLLVYCANPFNAEVWKKFVPNLIRAHDAKKMPMHLVLSGSVLGAVTAAAEVIKKSGRFKECASGVSPFFVDSYLPYYFGVFDAE